MGKQEYRTAVHGNPWSVAMPWEDVVDSLNRAIADKNLTELPRTPEQLKYLVRLYLRVGRVEVEKHLKNVLCLRPHVLVMLLHYLIDQGHEAFRGKAAPQLLKARVEQAVAQRYPYPDNEPETRRNGFIPEALKEILEKQQEERAARHGDGDKGGTSDKRRGPQPT